MSCAIRKSKGSRCSGVFSKAARFSKAMRRVRVLVAACVPEWRALFHNCLP
jgi:hypothetical protein